MLLALQSYSFIEELEEKGCDPKRRQFFDLNEGVEVYGE